MKKTVTLILTLAILIFLTLGLGSCAENEFEIKFIVDTDEYASILTVGNAEITLPENPTKKGYIFDGWYLDDGVWAQLFTKDYFIDEAPTENITVYAKWEKIQVYTELGLLFEINDDMKSYSVLNAGTAIGENIKIPESYNEYPVTSISPNAFKDRADLKRIIIPDTVTKIGDFAFSGCTSLESVTIGSGISEIGYETFENCDSIVYNTYGNAKYLGNSDNPYLVLVRAASWDFSTCSINENTKVICYFAFSGCIKLESIVIPDSIVFIGTDAFINCHSLEKVYISDIAKWCAIDFRGFYSNSLCYAKALYIVGNDTPITNLVIPDGVTEISDYAFANYELLESVTMQNGVIEIGTAAFLNSASLVRVTIPNSVTRIGEAAFDGCDMLANVEIPNNVTVIDKSAFNGCGALVSITIPSSVAYIGDYAFSYCDSLKSIKYEGTVEQWNAITKAPYWNLWAGLYTITYNYTEE